MKKTLLVLLFSLILILSGCSKKESKETAKIHASTKVATTTTAYSFGVKVAKSLPESIKPFKTIDVMDYIIKEEGVTYEFSGIYLNDRMKEVEMVFDGSKTIVKQDNTIAEISIEATKGNEYAVANIALSVTGEPDELDNGISGLWHEESITTSMNYDPTYIKDGDSSIKVVFNGYYKNDGVQFACITGHLSNRDKIGAYNYDEKYLSIYKEEDVKEAFEDAYVCFFVYNDMKDQSENGYDDRISFGVRIKESPYSGTVDMDWYNSPKVYAERGEWTFVYFSLKDIGKTTDFYKDLDTYYTSGISDQVYRASYDALNLKLLGKNLPYEKGSTTQYDSAVKYTFSCYIDGYDIMSKVQLDAKIASLAE